MKLSNLNFWEKMEGVNVGRWIDEGIIDSGDCLVWEVADSDPCALSVICVLSHAFATKYYIFLE